MIFLVDRLLNFESVSILTSQIFFYTDSLHIVFGQILMTPVNSPERSRLYPSSSEGLNIENFVSLQSKVSKSKKLPCLTRFKSFI